MEEFIKEIEEFAAGHGIAPSTASLHAVNDGKFYDRLVSSRRGPSIGKVEQFRAHMAKNPPNKETP